MTAQPSPRPLYIIAREILDEIHGEHWKAPSRAYAKPYATAMLQLSSIEDYYGTDSARSVVLYFLSNAGTWKGETARRIKTELREILK